MIRTLRKKFIAIAREVNDRLEKGLSPEEIRQLASLLTRVAKNLSEEDGSC
jgi:DNA-binding MarR family transcriptional regulator